MADMTMTKPERPYLPAAGRDFLLPLYDPLTRLLGMGTALRLLLEQAEIRPGDQILDVGCGTGTLAVMITQRYTDVSVIGVDPDPKALVRARRKAERAGVTVRFDPGYADSLGYPDNRFDRVFSSMMFHHLSLEEQPRMLEEVRRVLKPGGRLELLDFERPHEQAHGGLSRMFHSHARLEGNTADRIVSLMTRAGFTGARHVRSKQRLFGRIAFFQASA